MNGVAEHCEALRPRLAYRRRGSLAEAEDVVHPGRLDCAVALAVRR